MAGIFISYRRTDMSAARQIRDRIAVSFPRSEVFFDQTTIKPGADFPTDIAKGLDSADVVLAIISPNWTSVQHETRKMRRLDIRNDWVRIEIGSSLKADKIVIPVLIDGAKAPRKEELPQPLKPLWRRNAVSLDDRHFAEDLNTLIEEMRGQIVARQLSGYDGDTNPYPMPRSYKPKALGDAEQKLILEDLPRWHIEVSKREGIHAPGQPATAIELKRIFRFPSFRAAISFMSAAAERIDPYDHHPRWENVYQTVWVGLSTWDSGHTVSDRDYKTALMLERLYQDFLREL